jgi:hypothetical protein
MLNLDPDTHRYWDDEDAGAQFVSVSEVIRRVDLRKTHHGVSRSVLDFAAERGKCVERILTALLEGREPTEEECKVPDWEQNGKTLAETVEARLPGCRRFIDEKKPILRNTQLKVADYEAGIAGTLDFVLEVGGVTSITDCKCTYNVEADWSLQLGAYLRMIGASNTDSWELNVLHLKPQLSRGYILRPYNPAECLAKWEHARTAWMESRASFARAKDYITSGSVALTLQG